MIPQEKVSYDILCRTKTREELDAIKFDPNQKDAEQKNALIIAAKTFNAEDVALALLENFKGLIDVNAQDEKGCSALHYAIAFRNLKLARKLLENGADRALLNEKNKTPMDCLYLRAKEIEEILLSMDIAPERDVKAKGNKLSWHFRFLRMGKIYPDNRIDEILALPSTLENISHLRNYTVSDEFIADDKAEWIAALSLPENQLLGKTVIESIVSKPVFLEEHSHKMDTHGASIYPKPSLLNYFTSYVSNHPKLATVALIAASSMACAYFKCRNKTP